MPWEHHALRLPLDTIFRVRHSGPDDRLIFWLRVNQQNAYQLTVKTGLYSLDEGKVEDFLWASPKMSSTYLGVISPEQNERCRIVFIWVTN